MFPRGMAGLVDAASGRLDGAAAELNVRAGIEQVELVGHAPDGDEAMARARAEAVREALIARGVEAARLVIGTGDVSGTRAAVDLRVTRSDCPMGG